MATIDELNKKYGWNGSKEELIELLKADKYPIKYDDDILSYGWEIYAVCGHLQMENITQGKAREFIFAILKNVSDGVKYSSKIDNKIKEDAVMSSTFDFIIEYDGYDGTMAKTVITGDNAPNISTATAIILIYCCSAFLAMEWIDKNIRMPESHPEFDGCTKDVMVTDGENWGHGRYYFDRKEWIYTLNTQYECDDNYITHWAEPPVLPRVG